MREIKFRAWDVNNHVMHYNVQMLDSFNEMLNRDTYICQQFTGLKDKNGQEIFEGDILECFGNRTEIYYNPYVTGFNPLHVEEWHINGEVIGNMHQHPHLLTSSKEAEG